MATPAFTSLQLSAGKIQQSPELSLIKKFQDEFQTVGSSSTSTVLGKNLADTTHANCIRIGQGAPDSTAVRQLCVGGVRSEAIVVGAAFERVPVRIENGAGAVVTKYIQLYDA